MRLALEVTPLSRPGAERGLGRYVRAVREAAEGLGHTVLPVAVAPRSGRTAEFLDALERRRALRRLSYDVFHATTAYTATPSPSGRYVASILDLIPLDVSSHHRTGAKAQVFHRLAARADAVLTLSAFSAGRIASRLGVAEERLVVAPLPPAPVFTAADGASRGDADVLARLGVRPPYLVTVADLTRADPRKRVAWLPAVARSLAREGFDLVLAGAVAGDEAATGLPDVHGVGRVSDEELAALYRGATAFVHASAYEGQGLPPLEALACGTPVVAMDNTAIPEVVGDAGVLVAEEEPPQRAARGPHAGSDPGCRRLADACLALARDPALRRTLAARARPQAAAFSTTAAFSAALERAYGG